MVADLSRAAAQARTQQDTPPQDPEAPPEAPAVIEADVAFIVYRTPQGQTVVTPDLDAPISVKRQATVHEVIGMALNAIDDVRLMGTAPVMAEAVVSRQIQVQQAQMAKMQEMAVRQQMEETKRRGS